MQKLRFRRLALLIAAPLIAFGTTFAQHANPSCQAPSDTIPDTLLCEDIPEPARNFRRDFMRATIPFVLTGLSVLGIKDGIKRVGHKGNVRFLSEAENVAQYVPLGATFLLKACGVEGRSKWGRLLVSSTFSAATMALFTNGIKYAVGRMRPDGSSSNSFPSGHTATAFMAATILHKEYGVTRSPWYSAGGYAIASGVGLMRALNNRHWVSDVMVGAGVGIISTELGYLFSDLIFRDKYTIREPKTFTTASRECPSFLSLQLGAGILLSDMAVPNELLALGSPTRIRKNASAVGGIEGAYFPLPRLGLGARFRVASMPLMPEWENDTPQAEQPQKMKNDQMVNITADAGLYTSLPINRWCSMGAKLLVGGRFAGETWYWGNQSGNYSDFNTYLNDVLLNDVEEDRLPTLSLKGGSSFNVGAGLNVSFSLRGNVSWRINVDYDYARMPYQATFGNYRVRELRSAVAHAPLEALTPSQARHNYLHAPERYGESTQKIAQHTLGFSVSMNIIF